MRTLLIARDCKIYSIKFLSSLQVGWFFNDGIYRSRWVSACQEHVCRAKTRNPFQCSALTKVLRRSI